MLTSKHMSEGTEQFPKKPKMELSDKDCEMIGREFASVDSKMAKVYLAASHMSEEDINRIVSSTEKIPEKKGYKMDTEEKKEFYRKMAEEEEEAKKRKGETKKLHEELARAYRREVERLERQK